jgi:hypothetical protein
VLEGFAQKIINEERGAGRWPEHDAADLVQRAQCRALEGKLKRPDSHPAPATVGENGRGLATNSPAKAACRACPNGCDGEAMRLLCKRIRNDCRSSTRTRQIRDRTNADVAPIQIRDPADRLILRVDLEAAVARLSPKLRDAFSDVALNDRGVKHYAADNDISVDTAKKRVTRAKNHLLSWLRDYRANDRSDDRRA